MAKSKEYMELYRKCGYGEMFRSIARFTTSRGEIKVLVGVGNVTNQDVSDTITKSRIYAQINNLGRISKLYFFDASGHRTETWHISTSRSSHRHGVSGNHKHVGYRKYNEGGFRKLNKQERRFLREVRSKWMREKKHQDLKM